MKNLLVKSWWNWHLVALSLFLYKIIKIDYFFICRHFLIKCSAIIGCTCNTLINPNWAIIIIENRICDNDVDVEYFFFFGRRKNSWYLLLSLFLSIFPSLYFSIHLFSPPLSLSLFSPPLSLSHLHLAPGFGRSPPYMQKPLMRKLNINASISFAF